MVLEQSAIIGRNNFTKLVHLPKNIHVRKQAVGVEIGTHKGEFAQLLMGTWAGHLYCVDPYISGYDEDDPASYGDRWLHYKEAKARLAQYGNRVVFLEKTSEAASSVFSDSTLDFVYVDGNHRYKHVLQDLRSWWPKIVPGGIIGGHDIICPWEPDGGWSKEIQPAVFEFAEEVNVPIQLIVEMDGHPWSYAMRKP